VAIVDDDEDLREALASLLKASRFTIDSFSRAEAFLEFPRRNETRCLILDVRLPGMSGIELQKRLTDEGGRLPIVFISGHGDDSLRDLVMKAGAVAFLTKPVRSQTLLNVAPGPFRAASGCSEGSKVSGPSLRLNHSTPKHVFRSCAVNWACRYLQDRVEIDCLPPAVAISMEVPVNS
jgi:DNA-binding response OmpR family regulator